MKQPVWSSYHLFFHGSLNQVVTDVVKPTVGGFLANGQIDRFFFIRYNLGGPHIRLRLRATMELSAALKGTLVTASESFFARHSAIPSLPEETIRRINRTILATDPMEQDDTVYPNHSLQELPFRPETERYGGSPELLKSSLDYFAFSSLEALRFLADHEAEPRGRQLTSIARLLTRQALGMAETPVELRALLEYPMATWRDALRGVTVRADETFERQRDPLISRLRAEVEQFLSRPLAAGFEPALRFRWEIRGADSGARRRIKSSQMHMTANRLGLSNPEEVYVAHLLSRTARELAATDPELWRALERILAVRPDRGPLSELIPAAVAATFPRTPVVPELAPRKDYDWVHFVARRSPEGEFWVGEYERICGDTYRQIRKSLALLRRRQITAGREALKEARVQLSELGDLPHSFAHVMDRWYQGALAYYFYCVSDLDRALAAVDRAQAAVEAAVGHEPLLLPFALTCHEFPLHRARIAYLRGVWREAREQIELARQALSGERPLCQLADGSRVYFSQLADFYRQTPSLNSDEEAYLRTILDEEARRTLFERLTAGIYVTPVIPYL